MTQSPKEKANELLDNYWLMDKIKPSLSKKQAKQCALIAVDEILNINSVDKDFSLSFYWQDVKDEILKL